jgi:hypothetical protein
VSQGCLWSSSSRKSCRLGDPTTRWSGPAWNGFTCRTHRNPGGCPARRGKLLSHKVSWKKYHLDQIPPNTLWISDTVQSWKFYHLKLLSLSNLV